MTARAEGKTFDGASNFLQERLERKQAKGKI